ncbi:NAD(P)/FAD-dependent oxidoreductase [Cohnella pontilimi]|uniref:NAD(P)/FAD-dependent oxidoreductase n=1 Tax=Cohnella pontilimi TaxID=2564100 RepID=UPI00145D9E27|nr:NAD(P)/FAD-dependent oxidoreductase [Cohnella pontilimi]
MHSDFDAIVIGAGLAGSSMAAVLAEKGWRTLLIDRNSSPRHKACGEFLSPEAAALWRSLGLDSRIAGLGGANIDSLLLTAAEGSSLEVPLPAPALGISRYRLDSALQEAAVYHGAELVHGCSVLQIRPKRNGYEVDIRGKSERTSIEARTVFGCWGRNAASSYAKQSRLPRSKADKPLCIGIKVHVEGLPQCSRVELYFFQGGYIGLSPVEEGRHNLAALVSGAFFDRCGRNTAGVLSEACRQNPALALRLEGGATVPGTEAGAYPVLVSKHTTAWGDVPHVGDAARVIPPLCGDGMAMALRSVAMCVELADRYLCGELSLEHWKKRYIRQMRRHGAGPAAWGRLLETVLCHPALSQAALRLGARMPGVAARLFRATRQ